MSDFKRELRYIVIKVKDAKKYLKAEEREALGKMCDWINIGRKDDGKKPVICACIEDDWPEYETVWAMIEARVTGQPDELTRLRDEIEKGAKGTNLV